MHNVVSEYEVLGTLDATDGSASSGSGGSGGAAAGTTVRAKLIAAGRSIRDLDGLPGHLGM